jgi:hypothetical protein
MARLEEVFGVSTGVNSLSYVDRGKLDDELQRALKGGRHIVIHGGSKQGKSWLRSRAISRENTILVQCLPGSTSATLLGEALGQIGVSATLKTTKEKQLTGTLDFSGSAEVGKLFAKVKGEMDAGLEVTKKASEETAPIGQTPADLGWVSKTLIASERYLVLEDFHYLDESEQGAFAFILKAMDGYELFVVLVGVWPQDHLLTYYNGELDGRVQDFRLEWKDEELGQVLQKGCDALNIDMSDEVRGSMIRESFGNVGTLQRLAEAFCKRSGVLKSHVGIGRQIVDSTVHRDEALSDVADEMGSRYTTFADNFIRGMRRMSESLLVYQLMLKELTNATESDLLKGIDSKILLERINNGRSVKIRLADLTQALDRIDRLQVKIDIRPPVLSYNKSNRRIYLADRSFLFYRKFAKPEWPWDQDEEIANDLAVSDPLEI